jgi:hypothetical protein
MRRLMRRELQAQVDVRHQCDNCAIGHRLDRQCLRFMRQRERGGSYTARRRSDTDGEPDEEDEAEVENVPKPWGCLSPGL